MNYYYAPISSKLKTLVSPFGIDHPPAATVHAYALIVLLVANIGLVAADMVTT